MVEKEIKIILIFLTLILAVALLISAAGESTGTNGGTGNNDSGRDNNTLGNETNSNNTCSRDDDCRENYECEDGFCVLDDENETEDDCEWQCFRWSECVNGTETRTCENVNNCAGEAPRLSKSCFERDKVCCKITEIEIEDNETKTEIEYKYEDRTSCLEDDDEDETKEIVNNSFCREDIRERCEFDERKDRIKCRLENSDRFENFSESDESCDGLRNKGLCIALYVRSQNCYKIEGEHKDRCFKRVAEFREAQIAKEVNESENKTEARWRVRHYMVLVLYNLQERIEKAVERGKLTEEEGASLIDEIVEIKRLILEGDTKTEVRAALRELKDMWRTYRLENE